ncbi:hypothetical protein WJX82_000561 [Trebouxia sp. C0006]
MCSDFTTLSKEQRQIRQHHVDRDYTFFLALVAFGRDMQVPQVRAAARGQAWCGAEAVDLGLVDSLGGYEQAIAMAKTLAGLPQVVRRDPSARAAVAQLQDAVQKQEVGLGLAVLPRRMLSDISQDVDKLTRGFSSRQ